MRTITTNSYVVPADDLIICNSASTIYLSLPASVGGERQITVKNVGAGKVYITTPDLIDGADRQELNQYESAILIDYASGSWAFISSEVNHVNSIQATINAQDNASKTLRTIRKTIGVEGSGADFEFEPDEDQVEQVIELEDELPARGKLVNLTLITDEAFAGVTSVSCDVGTTSSGDELIAAADMVAANTIEEGALGALYALKTAIAARSIYVSVTPDADWDEHTAGVISVYISYIDLTNI